MSVARPIPTETPTLGSSSFGRSASADAVLQGATVVFDLDGTLVDTAPDLTLALNHCLGLAGIAETSVEIVRPNAGKGARAMLVAAYGDAGRQPTDDELARQTACFLAFYGENIAASSQPFPGALATMDRMARAGARLAVCTNKTEALAKRLLDELGLAHRFEAICGSDSFAARKPEPVHLLGTIALAGGEPGSALMIGDTDTDIEAARRIAVPSVLLDFGYDPDIDARAKASAIVSHFDQIDVALVAALLSRPAETGETGRPFTRTRFRRIDAAPSSDL